MDPIIKGDNTITWGTGTLYSLGHVQKITNTETGEEVLITGNNGNTVAAILFDTHGEYEVEVICKSGDTYPVRGADVTICGQAECTVKERVQNWENKGAAKLTLKATCYSFNYSEA